jgi:hypothetical protein
MGASWPRLSDTLRAEVTLETRSRLMRSRFPQSDRPSCLVVAIGHTQRNLFDGKVERLPWYACCFSSVRGIGPRAGRQDTSR